jgi:carbonic anhydrase
MVTQAALGQSGDTIATVPLVRQDFSDCSNGDVVANNPALIGGAVTTTRSPAGSTDVAVKLIRGTPNTTYHFYLKCLWQLGDIRTGADGTGSATFSFAAGSTGTTYAFDMYPEGAPAGNKYQSVRVVAVAKPGDYRPPANTTWAKESKTYFDRLLNEAADKTSCETGTKQSPINLQTPPQTNSGLTATALNYARVTEVNDRVLSNNGHTVELLLNPVDYAAGGKAILPDPPGTPPAPGTRTIAIGGQDYTLDSFHFHWPSEHLWDDKRFAMELHLVHVSAAGTRAVLGVFLEPGDKNNVLEGVFNKMADTKEKNKKARVAFTSANLLDMLPADKTFAEYAGSLTTAAHPGGCAENVTWRVFKTPIKVSQAQIDQFKATIIHPLVNARQWRDATGRGVRLSP